MTAICVCWFLGLGSKFSIGDVTGKCGFTVDYSNNAYRSASDTWASVIKSSFQIDHWVYCEYLCTAICLYHISIHPNGGQVQIEGQRSICRMQNFWKGSELSFKVLCVVMFTCRQFFMDYVQIPISLNEAFRHLSLPNNSWISGVQSLMRVVYYSGWVI